MPFYEYRCKKGHTFEVMQRMTDDPVTTCQTCNAKVERVFHPVAVHFKGSGFYTTDYGSKAKKKDDGGSGGGEKKESGGEKKASESSSSGSSSSASSSSSGSGGGSGD